MKTDLKILPAGDSAVVAEFGNTIDPLINDQVQALAARIHSARLAGIRELIPSFRSLLILYDPGLLSYQKLTETLKQFSFSLSSSEQKEKRIHLIPCCYGSHFGPDLSDMEKATGLSREEIIAIHSGVDYRIYMLGFLPGFVYLGGLDKRIEMPRLSTPRVKIPQGAVGIGGSQTGVYPLDSPGGWRLIGRYSGLTFMIRTARSRYSAKPVNISALFRFHPANITISGSSRQKVSISRKYR